MTSPVLDLSHHNPTPNWATIKAAGVVGVIHKATEGTSYVDPTLFDRARDALAAGLKWSTYHFLRPGSMQAQMQHYLGTVNPVPGERVCLDHEDEGVSLDDLCDAVNILAADPRNLQIAIYSGHVIREQLGKDYNGTLASKTSLWIAHYTTASTPSWPKATWPQWSLWQWTDSETVPGISAPVDGDRWNGSAQALVDWFGPTAEEGVQPAPEPDSPTVEISIKIKPGSPYRVEVNGQVVAG